jgi:hypothetical protein
MTLDEIKIIAESYGCVFYKTDHGFRVEYTDGWTSFIVNEFCIRTYKFDGKHVYFDSNRKVEKHGNDYKISEDHLKLAIKSAIESHKQKKIYIKKQSLAGDFNEDKS